MDRRTLHPRVENGMNGLARIALQSGDLFVSADTPYGQQQLFDIVDQLAKCRGTVNLDINRRQWTVGRADGHITACACCERQLGCVSYTLAEGDAVCRRCVSQYVSTGCAQPALGLGPRRPSLRQPATVAAEMRARPRAKPLAKGLTPRRTRRQGGMGEHRG